MIDYLSMIAMPVIVFIIIFTALNEKKNTFDLFLKGAQEGVKITTLGKWFNSNSYRNNEKLWSRHFNWINGICNNGCHRNNYLHNCCLYRKC